MTTRLFWMGCMAVTALMVLAGSAWAQNDSANGQMPGPPPGGGPPPFPSADEFDANHDGNVTQDEFVTAWDKMTKERFSRLDTDKSGTLSKEELAKDKRPGPRGDGQGPGGAGNQGTSKDNAQPPAPPSGGGPGGRGGPPPSPSQEDLDANHDGNVTADEFTAAWHKVNRTQFEKLDKNSDGVLSKDELPKAPPRPGSQGDGQRP